MPYASSIQTVNDANGTAYAFLEDNGAIWQCQWNAEAQRWDQGQLVPQAFGGEKLQALVLENLWPTSDSSGHNPGTAPGIVLAYRVGEGSSSQVLASFGRWGSDGQLQWSAPAVLSAPGVEVQQFALVPGEANTAADNGQTFSLVVQAQQAGESTTAILDQLRATPQADRQQLLERLASADRPDSDLYTNTFRLSGAASPELQTLQGYSTTTGDNLPTAVWGFSAALSQANAVATPAGPAPLLGGNTQLSRQALVPGTSSDMAPAVLGGTMSVPGSSGRFSYSGRKGNFRAGFLVGQAPVRWEFSPKLEANDGNDDQVSLFGAQGFSVLWNGSFGTKADVGGDPFSYSYARLSVGFRLQSVAWLRPKNRQEGFIAELKGIEYPKTYGEIRLYGGGGGSSSTRYNYAGARSNQIAGLSARLSAGANAGFKWVIRTETDNTFRLNFSVAAGWAWTQYAYKVDGLEPPIPAIAKLARWIPMLIRSLGLVYNIGAYKFGKWEAPNSFGARGLFAEGSPVFSGVAGVIGSGLAAFGPVDLATQAANGFPNAMPPPQYSSANGVLEKFGISLSGMYKGFVGLRAALGGVFNQYFSEIAGESDANTFYFQLAGLGPLGISIPIVSYSISWPKSPSALNQPVQDGLIQADPSGSYPFSYTPAAASNSYLSPQPTNTGTANPYLLGAAESLQLFTLSPYSGAINPPDAAASARTAPLSLYNAGSGLNDGIYSSVPLMAVGLNGGTQAFAEASFTVQNGSIVPSSLTISQGGSALALPESGSGSGIYALLLDVFSTGIATPPSSGSGNPFSSLPLITVDTTKAGSPLQMQAIQRVWSVPVDPLTQAQSQQKAGVIYPVLDASTNEVSPPPANNNAAYSYTNVPVQLFSTSANTSSPVPLLNGPATATVLLSNGVIQAVRLNQALLFSGGATGDGYSVQLLLPSVVTDVLPPSATPPSFAVSPQDLAYNNLVTEDQFSAQAGVPDSGVYLSAGVNDAVPLLPQMGAWPVQNRVVFATRGANGEINNVILNGQQSIVSGTEPIAALNPPSLEELYDDPSLIFSAASRPTAARITGPPTATYGNDTFVAWVEASDSVVPIISTDGSTNYQNYMQALYGRQRINYRIQSGGKWNAPDLADLYTPDGAVITELQAFNVANPDAPGGSSTLLVWSELSIDAIQATVADVGAGSAIPAVIKAGFLNPNARSLEWNDLFSTDVSGQTVSTIQTIPWDPSTDVGLTIEDFSIASQPLLLADGSLSEAPVVSWSQRVRTPYRQSVLDDEPGIYLELGALQAGLNSINIGTIQEPSTTATVASATGLNFALPGALPKSQAAAVQNIDGTGVLSTGLGSLNGPQLQLARSIPTAVAVFNGAINGTTLTLTSLAAGQPSKGQVLSGPGVLPGTTLGDPLSIDPLTRLGTYAVSQSQSVAAATLQALPLPTGVSSFSGAITGTTLTAMVLPLEGLGVGDVISGQGITAGTRITAVLSFDASSQQGTYSIDRSQSVASSALVAIPPAPSDPYTIEFWAQLQPGSNPDGAGLVALGQPSAGAIGAPVLPEGWLLGASFVVDRITYQQAMGQGLITTIPSGGDPDAIYGWGWALLATGADTTAMGGNGGSNLYSNALEISNLVSGVTLEGINNFLASYGLNASDLIGLTGSTAATMASVPYTQLQFNSFLDGSNNNRPISTLNTIAVDTNTAALNAGLLQASDVSGNLNTLFNNLWTYQQSTGEAKVSFNLAPGSSASSGTTPSPTSNEQYSGYALDFALLNGPAVSVNGEGQLVFDVAPGVSITANADLRDGDWHYIAATYLPVYEQSTINGQPVALPTLQGSASLLVDGQLVQTDSAVTAAYAAQNLSDQALLLTNNAGGGLDQLAIYAKALTNAVPSPGVAGVWPQLSTDDALAAIASAGVSVPGQSNNGTLPGAISQHWAARNVNPNDALLATYTSSFDPSIQQWSSATLLNPQLAVQPTTPSASAGSLQNDLVIAVPSSSWMTSTWEESGSSSADGFFDPTKQQLKGVSVTLTNLTDATQAPVTIPLTPDQVLIGSQSLQTLQPLASITDFNYTVLNDAPAFSLLIPGDQITPRDAYTAIYTFTFADGTSADGISVSNATPVPVNALASSVASSGLSGSTAQATLENRSKALATAAVLEQAPLQLQYIDSGEVFQSRPTAAASSNKALSDTPETFGTSQVFGSFDSSGNTNGWLAIAQPSTLNASSDPAGCVWIQYTGQSNTVNGVTSPSVDPSQAPSTWLNALADSNFVSGSVNLPLLGDALYPSTSGGLLIQADPTAGWGQQLGQTMLVADVVGNDGVDDLVLAAPAANGGGKVYIISGTWISNNLTQNTGEAILSLANPEAYGNDVLVLEAQPQSIGSGDTYDTSLAGFGTALAFDSSSNTLWIGAPNVLQQLDPADTATPDRSLVPVGAVYSYVIPSSSWGGSTPIQLTPQYVGTGGTAITPDPTGAASTSYWGSQLGSAIAISSDGQIAFSAPGVEASLEYSGTQQVQQEASGQKSSKDAAYGDGALLRIQLPSVQNGNSVSTLQGINNTGLVAVTNQGTDVKAKSRLAVEESTYMQTLKALQSVNIADATVYYNQSLQALPVGAVYLFGSAGDLPAAGGTMATLGSNAATFYGAQPWNVLGPSGFGSSLGFADLTNNNGSPMLAIGADQTGGSGAVYLVDTSQSFSDPSGWVADINLGSQQYLAHLASAFTLYGAADVDNFGNGLVNLGDVNGDTYEDLLIQAFNSSGGAGNGYVLFGTDQFSSTSTIETKSGSPTINNPAAGNVATSTIGQMKRADGSTFTASILSELGDGPSALTGLGSFGPGDVNGDGLPDILLGAGGDASAYLTYGQDYLESISDLQLQKLTSNTGYRLPGLATTIQGSLRSIGDFNDDGYGDFISIQTGDLYTTVRIELGANTQEILADYLYEDYSFTVANGTEVFGAGDINGDGYADIALFLPQNLSSVADGNAGAGSTTGILYGRASDQLPIGSGFGLQAPVDASSNPLASLPDVVISDDALSTAAPYTAGAPTLIADGDNLYAVVAGKPSATSDTVSLYFAQSSDSGNSWSNWTNISAGWSTQPTFFNPSLAFFDQKLYLAYRGPFASTTGAPPFITSWNPGSNEPSAWSTPTPLSSEAATEDSAAFAMLGSPSLLNIGTSLAITWVNPDTATVTYSTSTSPGTNGSWQAPIGLQQRTTTVNGGVTFAAIQATGGVSSALLGEVPVLAVQNNDLIDLYTPAASGQSWELTSSLPDALVSTLERSGLSLTDTPTGLALAYNGVSGLTLQRLDVVSSDGSLIPDEKLIWQGIQLTGVSNSEPPSLVNANGALLLGSAAANAPILLSAIPALSNPASSTWLNSTVQLPDGSGGWTVQQQSGGNSGLTPAQTGSSLSPVGDLNNDGYADLIVTASNVLLNPGSDPAGATQATGLRVITGAATSAELLSNNNPTANSQTVQVAPGFGGDAGTAVATLSTVSNGAPAIQITSTGLNSGQNTTQKSLASKSSQSDLIASAGDLASTQQLFNPATPPTSGPLGLGLGFGNLALNTTGSFGDLNADGYLDALADMPTSVYGANGLGWHVWSIRAAGDVNGNGTDDVLLSLVVPESASIAANSAPQWIQTVLLDGALFNVDTATNSFSFEALRFPLNPDSGLQINDSNPDSGPTWQWEPLLQYWLEPIQTYTPPTGNAFGDTLGDTASITALDSVASVVPGVANAGSQPSIAVAYYETGTYLVTCTQNASNGAPLVQIGFLNPNSYSPGWTIEVPSDVLSSAYSGTQTLSPSAAAVHDGCLYFVIDQSQDQDESGQGKYSLGDMHLFYAPLTSLEEGNADWRTYQLPATSSLQPALVSEGDRLTLYFASNNDNKQLLSIYSNDPTSSASWEGGSTLAWDSPNGTGDTITINSGSSTPLTANIAAARTLGPNPVTVLAFCMNTAGGAENDQVFVIQQPQPGSSNWSPSQAFNAQPGQIFLTSNSSQLLLATTNLANNASSYTDYDGSYGVTLYSAVGGIGSTLVGTTVQGGSDVTPIGAATVGSRLNVFTQPAVSWSADAGLQPIASSWAVVDVGDQSLSGYSIDSSIDTNGDGFMDMLVSDPSNLAAGLANQYVLFGGDYLNIASQVGTPANDVLIGTPLVDVIYSIQGSDQVISNGGADVIYTGAGDDQISIADNAFVRIDAGSGFDALLLEGEANQSYDFRLAVASSQYFAGTKLRDIELISSLDYGANALFFDAAAINAINPDRVLFVTPDASDSITLTSEFARNTNFDTSYGGVLWSAYAAAPTTASPTSSNPALVYFRSPAGQTVSWLSTNVLFNTGGPSSQSALGATAAPTMASTIPAPPPLSGVPQAFGDGLSLTPYRVNPGEGLARFRISRSNTSSSQLVAYSSSSLNASAELGPDATAVAGLIRLQPGQASAEITVPADGAALVALRNGSLSLLVEELTDLGQHEQHLLFSPAAAPDGAVPVLSGFDFSVDPSCKVAQLSFRADVNNGSGSPDTLRFQVGQRSSADAAAPPTERLSTLALLDAVVSGSSVPPSYDSDPAAYALDTDQRQNAQVRSQLMLDLMAQGSDPALFLSGPGLSWSSPASSNDGSSLTFDQTVNLSAWRADQGAGVVSFALVSGDRTISLLQNASGGTAGAITPDSALDQGSSGWRSTEGKSVGGQAALSHLNLMGSTWTPTASRDGQQLALQKLQVDGNWINAQFEGGVSLQLFLDSITSAPTATPVRPQVDIQRLAGQDNGIGFYAVDSITGAVDGLNPGESGYLQAALERSEAADLLLEASELPAFGQERTYRELALDPNRQYGVLLLVNGNREQLFSSFAAANPGGAPQMMSLGSDSNGMVLGIEDLSVIGGRSDRDFNDLIVKLGSVNVALF
jgi:hypothetical protein